MARRVNLLDIYTIGYYTALIVFGVALLMLVPLTVSLAYGETAQATDFLLSFSLTLAVGYGLALLCRQGRRPLTWLHGMVVASLSWLVSMVLGAVPYWLSGHYGSFLDATFDVMSGLTTTGVVLIQDLDHVSYGLNMWRHLLTFVGGQGVVVLALTFLVKNTAGAYKVYVGEAKDERLLPNVVHTAQAIWYISLIFLVVGTAALWLGAMAAGLPPGRAFWHALWVYMAAWSTGGFAPQSQNILYYHSFLFELITLVFFVVGSFNFALHYAVLSGARRELRRNIEIVSFSVTVTVLFALTATGLAQTGLYPNALTLFRRGFYQLISAHTTTGFMTLYGTQFLTDWNPLAVSAVIIAMLFGGSACSTAGGFKGLRLGIAATALREDVRRLLVPESAVTVAKFHHVREVVLTDRLVRSALLVIVSYIFTFTLGTVVALFYGYPLEQSLFEAASVMGNVGLTAGLTSPGMPALLKVTYIFMMWAGRMEFMSVFALIGYALLGVRK
ncbi:MAG TPA: TrkH family potassium uptake protein [Firmicutes bacterium]|nr:TrkH family potassium uptake protein [Bacillota bacterium]